MTPEESHKLIDLARRVKADAMQDDHWRQLGLLVSTAARELEGDAIREEEPAMSLGQLRRMKALTTDAAMFGLIPQERAALYALIQKAVDILGGIR